MHMKSPWATGPARALVAYIVFRETRNPAPKEEGDWFRNLTRWPRGISLTVYIDRLAPYVFGAVRRLVIHPGNLQFNLDRGTPKLARIRTN